MRMWDHVASQHGRFCSESPFPQAPSYSEEGASAGLQVGCLPSAISTRLSSLRPCGPLSFPISLPSGPSTHSSIHSSASDPQAYHPELLITQVRPPLSFFRLIQGVNLIPQPGAFIPQVSSLPCNLPPEGLIPQVAAPSPSCRPHCPPSRDLPCVPGPL